MEVENKTPFPAVSWDSLGADRREYSTTLVRVKYRLLLQRAGRYCDLRLTPEQGELFGEDVFFDDDITRPVRYESDFVTFKPNTDFLLNANAYSPDGKPQSRWRCAVQVADAADRLLKQAALSVRGPRQWQRQQLGWLEGSALRALRVPLDYAHAYGGVIVNPAAEQDGQPYLKEYAKNPAGTGVTHRRLSPDCFPAHQVEWSDPRLDSQPYPAGFGIINRAWAYRLRYAGTYDQHWLDTQHPYPPEDFDFRHHQAANPQLILDGYIPLNGRIHLHNLLPGGGLRSLRLPELYCFIEYCSGQDDVRRERMNIDTVLIDIDSDDPGQWALYLSYRHYGLRKTTPHTLRICYFPKEQLEKQGDRRLGHAR